MPQRELSQAEFEAIERRLIDAAPKGLSAQDFDRWFLPRVEGAIAEAENLPAPPEGSAVGRFASNLAEKVNPVAMAKGVYQMVRHPIDTAEAVIGQQLAQGQKAVDSFKQGHYIEAAGHGGAAVLPVIGPVAAETGEQIASGDVAGGLGSATGLVAPAVAARPVARAVGRAAKQTGTAMVRSAIKPTVTQMRRSAGASATGINAQADRLAAFITENGITTPQRAEALIAEAEAKLGKAIQSAGNPVVDAPQRAARYLRALSQSAARQGLPADDVAIIRSKAAELLNDSPLSETVHTTVMRPSPTGLVTASGQPVQVPVQVPSRALRTDVRADEALQSARSSGQWQTRKSWGEQKGAATESAKAVERATRDAVKSGVPDAPPILRRQGMAIRSKEALDRMAMREGNREPVSPFDVTTAAVELSQGRPPVLAIARHVLRENKLKMGVWANRLEQALQRNDVPTATAILDRFGVDVARATSPSEPRGFLEPLPAH